MLNHSIAAERAADEVIQHHANCALHFSGGKDSLATLHLVRKWWDRITVMWLNTGAALPETIDQMNAVRSMVPHFAEVKSDQPSQVALMGYPSDIVPTRNSAVGQMAQPNDGVLLQHYWECCSANIWLPMKIATERMGATLIIRGQRDNEARRAPIKSGHKDGAITILFPIHEWSSDQVFAFLRERHVEIPKHYQYVNTSLDCSTCTAFLDENAGKMRYLRDKHPIVWGEVRSRLIRIATASRAEVSNIEIALQSGEYAKVA